jgi:hypothetical protein
MSPPSHLGHCVVAPLSTCHLLLARPWQFDLDEGLSADLLRDRGKLIGGDLDVDDEGPE